MTIRNYTPLALIAADGEDIEVLSAFLQDAALKVGEMAYLPQERRFAIVCNRFVWEDGASRHFGPFARVRTGLHFDDVTAVRVKNLRQQDKSAVIVILSVDCEPRGEGVRIVLHLGGGGEIALDAEAVNATVRDISAPWRTTSRPDHGVR